MFDTERKLYEERTDTFVKYISGLIYEDKRKMAIAYCMFDPIVPFEERLKGDYEKLEPGKPWGKNWLRGWFHLTANVPPEWKGREVVGHISMGSEALVFDAEGTPMGALSIHAFWDPHGFRRDRLRLIREADGGEDIDLWMECSAAQLFGLMINNDTGSRLPERFGDYEASVEYADIAVFRSDIWDFIQDVTVLQKLMRVLPEKSVRRARILHALSQAIDVFTPEPETVQKSRSILKRELDRKSSDSDLKTVAVGHAHIDTAWLWPLEETIRKCGRTFSVQVDLLERYPDYVFGASMPQHYQFVKDHYPGLYIKIKKHVKEGRWEPQGGMWVEADCNLISGESMVRQILYGKQFFQKEFGFEVRNLWLPDVFGYSAAMPQVLRKSGLDYMITQKLSWSQFNRFPHHTFLWRGIDGTEVVTHFPPEDNYNSDLSSGAVVKARENFDEKAYLDEFLSLFGMGDGGGGATEEMLESGRRLKDLEGAPRVELAPAQRFLDRLGEKADLLPRWVGELYLEFHRGTFTTHAYNKKMNRKLEGRLRALELLSANLPPDAYPAAEIESIWKGVLLFQFHDIIPGSSVTPVYEHCREEYPRLDARISDLIQNVGDKLFEEKEDHLTVFNTLSVDYTHPLVLPDSWKGNVVKDESNNTLPVQIEGGKPVIQLHLKPFQVLTLQKTKEKTAVKDVYPDHFVLENQWIRYEFAEDGTIKRIYDKEQRMEVLQRGTAGNQLTLYEDRPVGWDAWDIDIYYEKQKRETAVLATRKWITGGPVRKGIEQVYTIGRSKIVQRIYLSGQSRRLDFETEVDWKEDHKMLRTAFAVNVFAEQATYEIQFGNVKRNTHRNTSWDMAKFESVGHRYADLSDHDYGVALLNDSKYGYKILDNVIDLNLLRAPSMPDPEADRGKHAFTYSLLPHAGPLTGSDVLAEALQLNHKPLIFEKRTRKLFDFPIAIHSDNVVLDTMKKAEDSDARIIRLYEAYGKHGDIKLELIGAVSRVVETDLMENEGEQLPLKDGKVNIHFRPFEIKTLKIK